MFTNHYFVVHLTVQGQFYFTYLQNVNWELLVGLDCNLPRARSQPETYMWQPVKQMLLMLVRRNNFTSLGEKCVHCV